MARREFQLVEGSSSKFWTIELDGDSYVVNFGRIGTDGQTREKSFESEAQAQAEHDKQIAAKVKKGYAEVGGASAPAAPQPKKSTAKKVANKKATAKKRAQAPPGDSEQGEAEVGELQRTVRLSAEERFVVTWEEHEPLQKPAPAEFDLGDCLKRLEKSYNGYYLEWRKAKIPLSPSPEEARFWLLAHASIGKRESGKDAARVLEKAPLDREMTLKNVVAAYGGGGRHHGNLFCCVAALLSPVELVDFMREHEASTKSSYYHTEIARAFRKFVLPYLSNEDRRSIYDMLEGKISNPAGALDVTINDHLGAMVGRHSEIAKLVEQFPDGHLKGHLHSYYADSDTLEWIVFGLPDRASVISESQRLGLNLVSRDAVIAWLALTEADALELIAESACQATNKAEATQLAKPIERVVAAEMAVPALQIATNSKVPQIGQEWLAAHPLDTAVGLAPAAKGSGKLAQAAKEYLHQLRRSGKAAFLEAATSHVEPNVAEWLRSEILESAEEQLEDIEFAKLPKDLREGFEAVRKLKLPTWLIPSALPPIKLGGQKLADAEVEILLHAVKGTGVTQTSLTSPAIVALKAHAEPTSLDNFAWKLFEAWLSMGAASKEKWAMGGIGHLGGDGCVLNLTPLLRQWPGESQHQRAVFGLQCLRAVNSETALMALNGIALKLKFKALKEKAKVAMEEIAESRGLTHEELADRIVPDCGLDAKGSRGFDFGPRQFQFVLGAESKPMVRDAAGKVRPNLPKPNKSDDPDKSETALAEWKILKKTLRETLKVQSERLEGAMITGRRWSPENFDKFIVKHPFMINLARQLVFAAYDDKGKMTQTFRVTEDQTIADQNDEETKLPSAGGIGVVHPAHLDEPTLSAWGEVLSDYGIIPPFQQLGRTICKPEPGDLKKTEITRFKGPKIPGIVMYGMLERSHWLRDTPADGGGFTQHSKYFPASDVTAFISYTGLSIGWYDEAQQLESIYFVPGHVKPEMWGQHKNRVIIGDVDPVVISEVLRLAHAIAAKAEP